MGVFVGQLTPRGEPYHASMSSVSETWRYIGRSAGVRSGNPIVEKTWIVLHDVIGLLQNGEIDLLVAKQMSAPSW